MLFGLRYTITMVNLVLFTMCLPHDRTYGEGNNATVTYNMDPVSKNTIANIHRKIFDVEEKYCW